HCLRMSRRASSAPRLSYLFSTTSSAKSSMSIFSSWLGAPKSLVITYIGKSTRSTISESLWPMPAVSTITRSKPRPLRKAMESCSTTLVAECWRRVAIERMYTVATQRVHADAVAQQRAAGAAAGRVDRDHRDPHLREAGEEAVEQLVGDRGLAGAAGAGDADYGGGAGNGNRETGTGGPRRPLLAELVKLRLGELAVLQRTEHAPNPDLIFKRRQSPGSRFPVPGSRPPGFLRPRHHILDHLHQPHLHPVIRVIDALDPVLLQLGDLLRRDGPAAAGEDADVAGIVLAQHVDHVLHVLDVPALVGRQRDGVRVLLQRRPHHVLHRAVVPQVDHLRALRLDQPAHDVDGRVVAVEQA